MSEWTSALDLEAMRTKWMQKRDAIDVRDMMEVIALAESLRTRLEQQGAGDYVPAWRKENAELREKLEQAEKALAETRTAHSAKELALLDILSSLSMNTEESNTLLQRSDWPKALVSLAAERIKVIGGKAEDAYTRLSRIGWDRTAKQAIDGAIEDLLAIRAALAQPSKGEAKPCCSIDASGWPYGHTCAPSPKDGQEGGR